MPARSASASYGERPGFRSTGRIGLWLPVVRSVVPRPRGAAGSAQAEPIPQYDAGGTVEKTGLALVHAGEEIIPSAQAPRPDSAAAAEIAAHEAAFPGVPAATVPAVPPRDLTLGGAIDYAQRVITQ